MEFALITEGASEHRIIKHIISRYFKEFDLDINQIQPKIVKDKQENIGGWNEVLKYCERDELKGILVENDYLVIQIDTDQSETSPFDVSHTKKGQIITDGELYDDIVAKLKGLIKPEILDRYGDKTLFAVCIHTIECWLLTDNHKTKTTNCLTLLNSKLKAPKIRIITSENKNKPIGIQSCNVILGEMKKKREIIARAKHNLGFGKFVDSLKAITIE